MIQWKKKYSAWKVVCECFLVWNKLLGQCQHWKAVICQPHCGSASKVCGNIQPRPKPRRDYFIFGQKPSFSIKQICQNSHLELLSLPRLILCWAHQIVSRTLKLRILRNFFVKLSLFIHSYLLSITFNFVEKIGENMWWADHWSAGGFKQGLILVSLKIHPKFLWMESCNW